MTTLQITESRKLYDYKIMFLLISMHIIVGYGEIVLFSV